jgi:hypothetical protein
VLAEAGDGEELLTADLDLDRIVSKTLIQDYVGHYNRSDIFTLTVNDTPSQIFRAPWQGADGAATGAATGAANGAPIPASEAEAL